MFLFGLLLLAPFKDCGYTLLRLIAGNPSALFNIIVLLSHGIKSPEKNTETMKFKISLLKTEKFSSNYPNNKTIVLGQHNKSNINLL